MNLAEKLHDVIELIETDWLQVVFRKAQVEKGGLLKAFKPSDIILTMYSGIDEKVIPRIPRKGLKVEKETVLVKSAM